MATILVLGGGYAGMRALKFLQKKAPLDDDLILVDQTPTHTEKTNLHEVAAGTIAPERITYDIRTVLDKRVKFMQAVVAKIDVANQWVALVDQPTITYDYLVVALGFQSETFGVPGADDNALPMDDLTTAEAVYQHLEAKVKGYATTKNHNDLKVAVCGAGFTGIELLGELTQSLPKLRAKYQTPAIKLVCFERMPSILPMFTSKLQNYAKTFMAAHDVEMKLGASITAIKPGVVAYEDSAQQAQEFAANTIIWTVGVSGSHVINDSGFEQRRNRVTVQPDLSLTDHPEVFIVGDVAAVIDPANNRPYPTTAQIALAAGEQAAKNIGALRHNQPTTPFRYQSSGTVASLSDRDGIGEILSNNRPVQGYPASVLKKVITDRSLVESAHLSTVLKKGRFDWYH
ncbi:NAD(P)/FAD-dependent oxidoreductase [Lactobacillus sp. CBA3605]|uniref:NAD(P)/FAD-dependent oxidoreductase n=1 Tax=Lactobacillus sp. CBA3605 TaxID=2099788 RepID=UPI000CFB9721|nr:NAD(P)/FAD-dependent oxidoreductase [Lactobacillus sp. CBA3605]AVK61737.1 NAD(P)/FAD-dependent oxidoreductase [Lactobacillus sp. CBA3605]